MNLLRFASVVAAWLLPIVSAHAQGTPPASGMTDLKPLIGKFDDGCFDSPEYRAFRKSLVPGFPIDVNRRIQIVAPAPIAKILGAPTVINKGEFTEFVIPVSGGHLNGVRVSGLFLAIGNANGVNVEAIAFDAPEAEVASAFKSELAEARRWARQHAKDGAPPSFGIRLRNNKPLLVCDASN